MMKKLIFLIMSVSGSAMAQVAPIEVAQECANQMAMSICRVPINRSLLAPGQTIILSGVGRVSMSAMADYTDLYNPQVPTDPAMCDLALHYMTTEPGGDHDKIARALWTPLPKAPQATAVDIAAQVLSDVRTKAALALVLIASFGFYWNRKVS